MDKHVISPVAYPENLGPMQAHGRSSWSNITLHTPNGIVDVDQCAEPYRLGCLMTHPIQYQAPLFRHLSQNPAIDLTVFFISDFSVRQYYDPGFGVPFTWDIPLLGGYRHVFLPCSGRREPLSFWRPWVHGIARHLKAAKIEALWVAGWAQIGCIRAILAAKALGIKVFLYGDSHAGGPTERSQMKLLAKRVVFPLLFQTVDAFLATATPNRKFYLDYGVPAERIFMMPWCVDNDFFARECANAKAMRASLLETLELEPGRPIILWASKLLERKRPIDVLEAYVMLSVDGKTEPRPYLIFVGDGAQRPLLEKRVRELGWHSVKFVGFKNQSELPAYFDLCDVFVLPPEREGIATVLAEVMNAAKPVIISDAVALGPDLVTDGENGFIVRPRDVSTLANRLRTLTENTERAAAMGRKSLERISAWNFESDEKGLLDALRTTLGRKYPQRSTARV